MKIERNAATRFRPTTNRLKETDGHDRPEPVSETASVLL